jgi:NADPH2 dehydrogenase
MSEPVPTFEALIKAIDARHPTLSYIHVVEPDHYGEKSVAPGVVRSNDFVDAIRLPRPVIHANNYTRESALAATEAKDGVVIAFARNFLANPDLPVRLQKEVELTVPDYTKLYFGNHEGYTDYPFASEKGSA